MQVRRPPLAVLPVAVILLASLPLRPDSRADDPGTLAPAAASPVAPAPAAPPAVLVFGSDHDFYPFEWLDDSGQPHGLNIDLMRALGRELGFEARFVLGPWSRIRHMFEVEGTIDVSDMFHSEIRGQVVKATVVLTSDYTSGDELVEELQEHVRRLTAPYKYPRIIEFLPELPKTISGKIRRVEIREKDKGGAAG